MKLRVLADQPWDVPADVLVVPIFGDPPFEGATAELDRRAGGELSALVTFGELSPKRFAAVLAGGGETKPRRLLGIRCGRPEDLDREAVVRIGASAERRLGGRAVRSLAVWLAPLAEHLEGGAEAAAELVARGVVEGSYDPATIYRDDVKGSPPALDELILVAPGESVAKLRRAAGRGRIIGEGANYARTLSNRSSNDVSPEVLADEATAVAKRYGLTIDVIDPARAAKLGMGLFMAVGRGSDNPPRMIVIRAGGKGERDGLDRHLAIVGKGVCFDSGGISIKPDRKSVV